MKVHLWQISKHFIGVILNSPEVFCTNMWFFRVEELTWFSTPIPVRIGSGKMKINFIKHFLHQFVFIISEFDLMVF